VSAHAVHAIIAAIAVSIAAHAQDRVERRGGEPALSGTISEVSDAGVTIRSDLGATHFVPWDRVRSVGTKAYEREVARYREVSLMLWRGRSRVERGDTALAEPLFERLFEIYRGTTHETALVVGEGLLRCRLARGEEALALIPALEAARLRRAGVQTVSYSSLPQVMHDDMSLCIVLPPFWADSPLFERLQRELDTYDSQGDAVIASIASLYAQLTNRANGPRDGSDAGAAGVASFPDHPGVELLRQILESRSSAPEARHRSRTALLAADGTRPVFADAWARFFAGWSLLGESGVVRRQRGMMNMLYVPALYGEQQKLLAGAALAIVAHALEEEGKTEESSRLRHELAARYPYHPMEHASAPLPHWES